LSDSDSEILARGQCGDGEDHAKFDAVMERTEDEEIAMKSNRKQHYISQLKVARWQQWWQWRQWTGR